LSKINNKSCIDKPVEYFSPIISLDFEFSVSEDDEEENEDLLHTGAS